MVVLDAPGHLAVAVAGQLCVQGRCLPVLLLRNWANRQGRLFSPQLLASLLSWAPAAFHAPGARPPPLLVLERERLCPSRSPATRLDDRYLLESEAFPSPGLLKRRGVAGAVFLYVSPLESDLGEYASLLRQAGMPVLRRILDLLR